MTDEKIASSIRPKPSFGWLIIIGPVLIIVALSIFDGLPWVVDQSALGAEAEARSYTKIGRDMMKNRRYNDGAVQFNYAIKIKPDYAEAYMSIGVLYYLTGDNSSALSYLQKAIDLSEKDDEIIYNNLGLVYEDMNELEKALSIYHKAAELGIKKAKIHRNIGLVEMKLGNYSDAIKAFRTVIDEKPTLYNQYVNMLKEELHATEDDDIVEELQLLIRKGVTSADLERYDNVVVDILMKHNLQLADDYKNLALAYENDGQYDAAVIYFYEAASIDKKSTFLLNKIGIISARLGNFAESESAFKKALKIDPNDKGAKLGMKMLMQGRE